MEITPTEIPDVKVLTPKKFGDHRGFFSETYNRTLLREAGITLDFMQDNQSLSEKRGVLRGLHYQIGDFAQDKLVRVLRGSILDVAVDIRRGSATFGKHVARELSAANWRQMLVPVGFAHGFVTLEANTEVFYKVTNVYKPEAERGIQWNDPALGITWGVEAGEVTLSDRDRKWPPFAGVSDWF